MKKHLLYIIKHIDFMLVDVLAMALSYQISIWIRRNFYLPIYHAELFYAYGAVLILVYCITSVVTQNLSGVIRRSIPREMGAIGRQMLVTWCGFTAVLYLVKEAYEFSRSIYLISFVMGCIFVLVFRTLYKHLVRYTKYRKMLMPKMLVICDSDNTKTSLSRIIRGHHENAYMIAGVIMNDMGQSDYSDHFESKMGLDNIDSFVRDNHIRDAYVDLRDAAAETEAIDKLLALGVTVHKSLGDSQMNYLEQKINRVSQHSVITIKSTNRSLVTRLEDIERQLFNWFWNRKNK